MKYPLVKYPLFMALAMACLPALAEDKAVLLIEIPAESMEACTARGDAMALALGQPGLAATCLPLVSAIIPPPSSDAAVSSLSALEEDVAPAGPVDPQPPSPSDPVGVTDSEPLFQPATEPVKPCETAP